MTLQTSGPISMADIYYEIFDTLPTPGTNFSLNDAQARELAGIPSGAISLADFYGKGWILKHVISANATNLDLTQLIQDAAPKKIEITINSGVVVYSTDTNIPALKIGVVTGKEYIKLFNNGIICGAGGRGGNGGSITSRTTLTSPTAGEPGGSALEILTPTMVINNNIIQAGGSGGNGGGAIAGQIVWYSDYYTAVGGCSGGGGAGYNKPQPGEPGTVTGNFAYSVPGGSAGAGDSTDGGYGVYGVFVKTTTSSHDNRLYAGNGRAGSLFGGSTGPDPTNAYTWGDGEDPGYWENGFVIKTIIRTPNNQQTIAAKPAVVGDSNITWNPQGVITGAIS